MHEHNINEFFENSFKNVPNLKTTRERKLAISYLCGMLCHYTIDYHVHPYVYSKSKYKKDKNNRLCIGYHLALEMEIDRILLKEKKGLSLAEFNQGATLRVPMIQNYLLSKYVNQSLQDTFEKEFQEHNFKLSPKLLRQILFEALIATKFFQDPHSIKKNITLFIEKHFIKYTLLSSKFITNEPTPIVDPLNLNRRPFKNTWDDTIINNESVPIMYKKSIEKCHEILESIPVISLVYGKCADRELEVILKSIGSFSYHSGLQV